MVAKETKTDMMDSTKKLEDRPEDVSLVKTFEDLLEMIGTRGPWNVMLFFLTTYACFLSPFNSMSYQFLGATPDYWCRVAPLVDANWTQQQVLDLAIPYSNDTGQYDDCDMYNYNYTAAAEMGYETAMKDLPGSTNQTITCPARDFNHTQYQSTVVTEWDLVCTRRALYSTTQSVASAGNLVGSLITGFLFDRYGRRRVMLLDLVLYILVSILIIISPSIELYIVARFFIAFFSSGLYNGGFIMVMETCATRYRSAVGALSVIPWALGYMMLPGVAYLVRTWRWLALCLAMPLLPAVSYFWLLPESPRWLIQSGRHDEALTVLKKAAKMNKKRLPSDSQMLQAMAQISHQEESENPANEGKGSGIIGSIKSGVSQVMAPLVHPNLRFRALVYIMWFNGSLVYYGVSLNATNISVDVYIYMFLGGLLEIPSYLLLWPAITYLGRRKTQATLYLLCGICILMLMVAIILPHIGSEGLLMTLSLAGKMLITAVYQLTWLYTTELYPTKYRSIALSQSLFFATISSTATPYINDLLGTVVVWAPSAIFGCASLFNVGIAVLLPETKDSAMPEMSDLASQTKPRTSTPMEGVTNDSFVNES